MRVKNRYRLAAIINILLNKCKTVVAAFRTTISHLISIHQSLNTYHKKRESRIKGARV